MASIHDRVRAALRAAEYPDPAVYAILGGLALVTAPERYLPDGRALSTADRWTTARLPVSSFDLSGYARNLFLGSRDNFRWLIFYATRIDFANSNATIDIGTARLWAASGFSALPDNCRPIGPRLRMRRARY
jgi:hypothetical protein